VDWIKKIGPKRFNYFLDLEIDSRICPKTWKKSSLKDGPEASDKWCSGSMAEEGKEEIIEKKMRIRDSKNDQANSSG